ncbi:MAG TPA: hypothetical protein VLT36_03800 [Candidatus Dormibacteraeota bacterium]|nr:hypothetical protein [Candidatus Dormibacteraeota bacterium]
MSDTLTSLIAKRMPIIGLAAYSIDLLGRVPVTECISKTLYASATGEMLSAIVRTGRKLLPADQGGRYCWVFECLRVHVAARADGLCLALMVENGPGVQSVRIEQLLKDFSQLQEVACGL